MQCLEIKPLDPVFFRNSAPFTMGDETTAQEMFPPNPSVIYGAIRASFFNEGNISLAEIRKKTEKLKIESIYYKKGNKAGFLIPLPADICKIKKNNKIDNYILNSLSDFKSEALKGKKYITPGDQKDISEVIENAFFELNLKKYILGSIKNESKVSGIVPFDSITMNEAKIGIGRDNISRSSEEGKLYRTDFIRWEGENKESDLSLIVAISGLNLPDSSGYLKLGGEAKLAFYKTIESLPFYWNETKPRLNKQYFKLVLLTPTFIRNEEFLDKAICKIINKVQYIGGFDIRDKKPKPLRKAYPAGSVFFFESNQFSEERKQELIETYHGKANLCSEEDQLQGYGMSFLADIGEVKNGK